MGCGSPLSQHAQGHLRFAAITLVAPVVGFNALAIFVTKKADRPAHRIIPKSRFAKLETIDDVIQKLIGV
jgi:hypothetical protein